MDTGDKEGRVSRGAPAPLSPGARRIVTVEFLLLPAELVIKLPVKLHLQHLCQHQVAAGVANFIRQQQIGCWTEGRKQQMAAFHL